MSEDLKRTPLYDLHVSLGAKMVPFAGWEMPVQYNGILAESRAVRSSSGLFDVSHMGRLYISGPQSPAFMDWILSADASNLRQGRARYSMVCNEDGGIIDDTVFYRQEEERYLLVCNASNLSQVLPWMQRWALNKFPNVAIDDRTEATAMIAFQGPATLEVLDSLAYAPLSELRPFSYTETAVDSIEAFVGRTGYTGEDGFELIVPTEDASRVWETLVSKGAAPCGLGSRDVLRLEAGLALHGNDIDASTTPLEASLERYVQLDKQFVGVEALRRQQREGVKSRLVGLEVEGRSIARGGYPILAEGVQAGRVTSGTLSPTLDRNIAMGYVTVDLASSGKRLQVDIRGRSADATVVPRPFYSRGATK